MPIQYRDLIIKTRPTVKHVKKQTANTTIVVHNIIVNNILLFDIFSSLVLKFENAPNTIYFI